MEHQKLTTILFDLDGTLLPMDNDAFTRGYFKLLAARLAPLGYEPVSYTHLFPTKYRTRF